MGGPGVRPRRAVGRTARGCRAGRSCTAGAGVPRHSSASLDVPRHPLAFLGIPRLLGRAGALTGPRRPSPGAGHGALRSGRGPGRVRLRAAGLPAPARLGRVRPWPLVDPGPLLRPALARAPAPAPPDPGPFRPTPFRFRGAAPRKAEARTRPWSGPAPVRPWPLVGPALVGLRLPGPVRLRSCPGSRAARPRPRSGLGSPVGPRLPGPPWPRLGPGSPVGPRLPRRSTQALSGLSPRSGPGPARPRPPSAPADVRGVC